MATTEIEDLAAIVGIEILPDNVSEDGSTQQKAEETLPVTSSDSEVEAGEIIKGSNIIEWDEKKLSALEEEFADRYSQSDEGFVHTLSTPTLPPPCVSPWWSNDRGNDRSRGRGRGHGWNQGRGQGWGGGRDDRRRDNYRHERPYQDHGHQRDNRRDHYRDREPHGHRDRSPVDRY